MSIIQTKRVRPNILYFDIETTNLKGNFGEIIVFGYRWEGDENSQSMTILDFDQDEGLPLEKRDRSLLKWIYKEMIKADVIVGHFSEGFDFRFLQTRMLIHGLPVLPKIAHVDTWKIAKFQLAFTSNRMEKIAESLDLDERKSSVDYKYWRRSLAHDEEAIRILEDYCLQDVNTQYEMTQKLLPLATSLPNMQLLLDQEKASCPVCTSTSLQRRGYQTTKTQKYARYVCNACGSWSRSRQTAVHAKRPRMAKIG